MPKPERHDYPKPSNSDEFTDTVNALFLQFKKLGHHVARKYAWRSPLVGEDDIDASTMRAIALALKTYDSQKGAFSTHLTPRLKWEFQKSLVDISDLRPSEARGGKITKRRNPKIVSLDEPTHPSSLITRGEVAHDRRERPEETALGNIVIAKALDRLTQYERLIVERHLLHGDTIRNIAADLKKPYNHIRSTVNGAIHKMRLSAGVYPEQTKRRKK